MATASKKVTCTICNKDFVKLRRHFQQMPPNIEAAEQDMLIYEERMRVRDSANLEQYFHFAYKDQNIRRAMSQSLKKGK